MLYILEVLCYNNFRQLKENRSFFELFTVFALVVFLRNELERVQEYCEGYFF